MDSSSVAIIAAVEPSVPIDSPLAPIRCIPHPSSTIPPTPLPPPSSIDPMINETEHSFCPSPSLDSINSLSIPSFASSISLPAASHLHRVDLSASSHYHPSIASCHAGARLSAYCYPSNAKTKSSPYHHQHPHHDPYAKLNELTPVPLDAVNEERNQMDQSSSPKEENSEDKEKQLKDLVQSIRSQPPTPPSSAAIFQSMQSKNRAMLSMIGPANAIRNQEERCMSDVATQIQTFLSRYKVESKMYAIRPNAQRERPIIIPQPTNAEHSEAKNALEQQFRRSFRAKVTETKSDERNTAATLPSEIKGSIHNINTNDDSINNQQKESERSSALAHSDGVTLGAASSASLWARRQSSKGDGSSIDVSPSQIPQPSTPSTSSVFNAFPTSLSSINNSR